MNQQADNFYRATLEFHARHNGHREAIEQARAARRAVQESIAQIRALLGEESAVGGSEVERLRMENERLRKQLAEVAR